MKKYSIHLLGALSALLLSCSNELESAIQNTSMETKPLTVSVSNQPISKTQVEGVYMPNNAELGVFLTGEDGSTYDGNTYSNVKYTSTGTGPTQVWTMDPSTPVALSATKGVGYAYYPRSTSDITLTSIPITNDGSDWMYSSSPVNDLSITNNNAQFHMTHAMTIIRCKLVKGDYFETGSVESLKLRSASLATNATLNLSVPEVTSLTGTNNWITEENVGTLSATPIIVDVWGIPTGGSNPIEFSLTIDGNNYKVASQAMEPLAGSVYNYTLTINSQAIEIKSVSMSAWNEVEDNGISSEFDRSIEWDVAKTQDGVYAITSDGKALPYEYAKGANYLGVGFVVEGKAYQLAKTNATGHENSVYVFWWKTGYKDILGLTYYTKADDTNDEGCLPKADGSWAESPHLDGDWTKWSNYNNATAALSDFNGKANTNLIIAAQTTDGVVQDYTLAKAIVDFRGNSSVNEGQDDWFAPACGELAFMFLQQDKLNTLLSKVSGTQFSSWWYWSSSEYDSNLAWSVSFESGCMYNYGISNAYTHLRLIREI